MWLHWPFDYSDLLSYGYYYNFYFIKGFPIGCHNQNGYLIIKSEENNSVLLAENEFSSENWTWPRVDHLNFPHWDENGDVINIKPISRNANIYCANLMWSIFGHTLSVSCGLWCQTWWCQTSNPYLGNISPIHIYMN